ncbi:MAG: lipid-A-disaccharide synthase [Scytolyngbya sp. HA4215-MV1]|jgi:lipid-A-disaccharide synthase|nr:lipid-A-disaccharide synthase [Scytolyngbya sp. HA4215-MV1]
MNDAVTRKLDGEANSVTQSSRSSQTLRLFISTGEVSGDLQGALLIEALQRQAAAIDLKLEVLALGGDRMAAAGAKLLGVTNTIGSIGIFEALPFVLPTLQIQRRAKQYLRQYPPDLIILIDYLGPNLTLGSYLHRHLPQIPLIYYIAPQEWVWSLNAQNTRLIVKITRRLLAIFPEEARYYRANGAQVTWVGHPLIDRMQDAPQRQFARQQLGIGSEERIIALLPASRQQEVKYLMPIMFEAAQRIQAQLPDVRFWVPLSLERYRGAIEEEIRRWGLNATIVSGQTQAVIAAADLAITKSGTVNLEIALMDVPQVVVYRVSPLTYWIAKHIIKFSIPFMSPPNLVEMQPIVPEFLQHQVTPENVARAAIDLLTNPQQRQAMLTGYQSMKKALGEPGVCDRAAKEILSLRQPI